MSLHCSGGLVCSKQSWMACEGQGSSQLYCVLIAFESRGGGAATQQPAVLHSMGLVLSPLFVPPCIGVRPLLHALAWLCEAEDASGCV